MTLGDTSPGAFGKVYENGRGDAGDTADVQSSPGCTTCRKVAATQAPTLRPSAPDVPAPKASEEKSEGIGGFLDKHKWQLGGALAGGLASLALGGGIFGLLIGLVVSVAVAFLGPKIFSGKT